MKDPEIGDHARDCPEKPKDTSRGRPSASTRTGRDRGQGASKVSNLRDRSRPRRVLAISSGGGHWIQLTRLAPAFEGSEVTWVTVTSGKGREEFEVEGRMLSIPDATQWEKLRLIRLFLKVLYCVIRVRPHVIVSTGAAPGYFAMMIGRYLRIRTCWIDSIANIERMSLSGRMSRKFAGLWLTQWKHLERPEGPAFSGSVLPELDDALQSSGGNS